MFIQDRTGGVFVNVPLSASGTDFPTARSEIEVTGVSGPGDFAAVVTQSHIRILSRTVALPPAKPVTFPQLLSGVEDCRWVQIEGTVQSVFEAAGNVVFQIAMDRGTIAATTVRVGGADYAALVDVRIKLRAHGVESL